VCETVPKKNKNKVKMVITTVTTAPAAIVKNNSNPIKQQHK